MKAALGFHAGDVEPARDLLLWINQLEGGAPQPYDLLLIADAGVDWSDAVDVLDAAQKAFRHATIITTETAVSGWPQGANTLFLKASEHCQQIEQPFLWLEPDCVPLAPSWLTQIHQAYSAGFLGHIYECNTPGLPQRLLSGVAVYPTNAYQFIHPSVGNEPTKAWDVSAADIMLAQGQDSSLFHHFWGEKGLPPTFIPGHVNSRTLEQIRRGAVLFHRNKDGTLKRAIATKLGFAHVSNFVVVLPVCNMDAELMLRLLDWIYDLGNSKSHEALVSYDQTTIRSTVARINSKASACFATVHLTSYGVPKGTAFPQTAAWHHAAKTMEKMGRPWLWLEADCVPLKPNWLAALQAEYDRCGKPFCGPVIHGPGHLNGTAIYPANTPQLLPRTMTHTNNAFDVECREEMGPTAHDSALWCVAWGVTNGRLDPIGGTELPSFPKGSPLLHQIRRSAVIYHRDKTGSLIERLRGK